MCKVTMSLAICGTCERYLPSTTAHEFCKFGNEKTGLRCRNVLILPSCAIF
jgi:hypothetical protein